MLREYCFQNMNLRDGCVKYWKFYSKSITSHVGYDCCHMQIQRFRLISKRCQPNYYGILKYSPKYIRLSRQLQKNKDFSDGVFGIGEYYLYNCIGHHHTWLLLECHLGLRLDPIDCKNIFLLLLFIKAKQILKLEMVI